MAVIINGIQVYDAAASLQGAAVTPAATDAVQLIRLGEFTGTGAVAAGRAESVDFDPASDNLYITNLAAHRIDIARLNADGSTTANGGIVLTGLPAYGAVNSVAVKNGVMAVAYQNAAGDQAGFVALFDTATNTLIKTIPVGVLPDQVVYSADGKKLLVANEGETLSAANNPAGSVSIIDLSGGAANATVSNTISFGALNGQEAALKAQGLALFPGQAAGNDIEPEYITISPDGTRAYVTLQEVNAVAVIDLTNPTADRPLAIQPLGTIDRQLAGNALDPNDQNGILLGHFDIASLLQPDAIASFTVGGATYFVTANEGDARVGGLVDEVRLSSGSYQLDPTAYPDTAFKASAVAGRLNVLTNVGDTDGDGDYDQIHTFGGRGISIFRQNADGTITKVRETGGEFEAIIAQAYPALHNSENGASPDNRSDNKGPEPEGVAVGSVGGRLYAFVTLERVGGVMIYDVTNPAAASFVGYKPATAQDFAPEVVKFVSAADSPTGQALLVSANEISGTTTIYTIANQSAGPDRILGGPAGDFIEGRGGADTISAFAGDDTLDGGAGADLMRGGLGNDTYLVDSTADNIDEKSGQGTDTVQTSLASYKLGSQLENLVFTGVGPHKGDGGSGDNGLTGAGGADTLDGGSGHDSLSGGAGADDLDGGSGDDALDGGADNDLIKAGSGQDTLNGGGGDDTLDGGSGADLFVFGPGFGDDRITDFRPGLDALDWSAVGGPAPTIAAAGRDTLISFGDGSSIRLAGVAYEDFIGV